MPGAGPGGGGGRRALVVGSVRGRGVPGGVPALWVVWGSGPPEGGVRNGFPHRASRELRRFTSGHPPPATPPPLPPVAGPPGRRPFPTAGVGFSQGRGTVTSALRGQQAFPGGNATDVRSRRRWGWSDTDTVLWGRCGDPSRGAKPSAAGRGTRRGACSGRKASQLARSAVRKAVPDTPTGAAPGHHRIRTRPRPRRPAAHPDTGGNGPGHARRCDPVGRAVRRVARSPARGPSRARRSPGRGGGTPPRGLGAPPRTTSAPCPASGSTAL